MGGERVGALRVDWRGAGGDRTHAVLWERRGALHRLTAREAPGLLRWQASYDGAEVDPQAPPHARITAPDGRAFGWEDSELPGELAGDLGRGPVTLRRDLEGQQDLGRTLLLTSEASRLALEAELGTPVDLRRFRTNLHLALDAPGWAERDWTGGRVELEGGVVLRLLHPCERCAIPTRDPETTEKWPQLLRHLAREHGTGFGINARVEVPGTVAEGARARYSA